MTVSQRCLSISPNRHEQCYKPLNTAENWHDVHEARGLEWVKQPDLLLPRPVFPWPRLSFSGARKMRSEHESLVIGVLERLIRTCEPMIAVTGAAVGFDAFLAQYLFSCYPESRVHVHTVVPSDGSQLDPFWRAHCHSYENMPDGTSFQQRNERMVDISEMSYSFPLKVRQQMGQFIGGTWRFTDYARRRRKIADGNITVLGPTLRLVEAR